MVMSLSVCVGDLPPFYPLINPSYTSMHTSQLSVYPGPTSYIHIVLHEEKIGFLQHKDAKGGIL